MNTTEIVTCLPNVTLLDLEALASINRPLQHTCTVIAFGRRQRGGILSVLVFSHTLSFRIFKSS